MSDQETAAERPASFREVFALGEFRAVFVACVLSWVGDYMAKAAVTVLVYDQTGSVALSAASFAVSYLPWLVGGPVLAAIAERYPYRRVMVICDVVRMVLIAAVAIPGLPIWMMLVLLLLTMLANPPTQAARSALMPMILSRDRLVVGLSVQSTTAQAAQIGGYLAGAGVAAVSPATALLLDSATFAISALVIRFGVRHRPATANPGRRAHLLTETADGFRVVFGDPLLRWIAIIVFGVMLFAIVPEGLAAAWAGETSSTGSVHGLSQAMIMVAGPAGFILGGLSIGRLVRPELRRRLIRPFAVLAPAALVPALASPPPAVVVGMAAVSGFAVAGMLPTVNGLFVLVLRQGYRARAFGVMQAGMQLAQGGAVLCTGLLAEYISLPRVVGLWSVGGTVLMLVVTRHWPGADRFNAAIAAAAAADTAQRASADPGPAAASAGRNGSDPAAAHAAPGTPHAAPGTPHAAPGTPHGGPAAPDASPGAEQRPAVVTAGPRGGDEDPG